MTPEELIDKLTEGTPTIKEEGDADYPSGNADGVIFFGARLDGLTTRHGIIVALKDKQTFYHTAMTYVRRLSEKERTRPDGHVNRFGVCCPQGLLPMLLVHYPEIAKSAEKNGRKLELLLADDPKWRFDAITDKRLPYWHLYPVVEGVWAIVYDEDIEESSRSKSLLDRQREKKGIAVNKRKEAEVKMENEK